MYDFLKPSLFWKIWQKAAPNFISGGRRGSDGLDTALDTGIYCNDSYSIL